MSLFTSHFTVQYVQLFAINNVNTSLQHKKPSDCPHNTQKNKNKKKDDLEKQNKYRTRNGNKRYVG